MNRFYKAQALIFVAFLCAFSLFSQTIAKNVADDKKDYILLTMALNAFESGDYGLALSLAEESKTSRIQECEYKNYVFQNLQKLSYVRRQGDNLTDILSILKEHDQNEAYNLINEEIYRYGLDYFSNSYVSLITKNIERKAYPEADHLVGKIYCYEGEFELSKQFLLRAYDNRFLLDVPDVQYDILYALADLSSLTDNYADYEKYLLLILKDNRFYTDEGFMNAILSIIQKDNDQAIEKFFNLYRCKDYFCINALNMLSVYYKKNGDMDKALRCSALGSITALTRITECLSDRLYHYEFKGLGDMLVKCAKYDDVVLWGNKNGIWELFYNFADISSASGNLSFGRGMFMILMNSEPEEYWRKRSAAKLIS